MALKEELIDHKITISVFSHRLTISGLATGDIHGLDNILNNSQASSQSILYNETTCQRDT